MKHVFTPNPNYIHKVLALAQTRNRACNPLGKVPVPVMDDGQSLYGGQVICEYLDSLAGRDTGFAPRMRTVSQPNAWR